MQQQGSTADETYGVSRVAGGEQVLTVTLLGNGVLAAQEQQEGEDNAAAWGV